MLPSQPHTMLLFSNFQRARIAFNIRYLGVVSVEPVVVLDRAARFIVRRDMLSERRAARGKRGTLASHLPAEVLFHGTRRANVAGIVRNGLVLPEGKTARRLGVGIVNGNACVGACGLLDSVCCLSFVCVCVCVCV